MMESGTQPGRVRVPGEDVEGRRVLAEHHVDPAKVVSIPRGVDLDRFNPSWVTPDRVAALKTAWDIAPTDRRTRFLLAGRLTRIKGHATIVEAAKQMKAAGRSDFVVLFAGDDQGRTGYRQELVSAIAEAGLEDAVRIRTGERGGQAIGP